MVNLALSGLGAPFAIALSQRLALNGMYAWTRNPMILALLLTLFGLGLWLRSGLFLIWTLVVFAPAVLAYLVLYEERELEIRFGDAYLDYKACTPMLWPRRPRPIAARLAILARAARRKQQE
jgi:protein-S-isoprenylcysteine O-methyltransferase Ste14